MNLLATLQSKHGHRTVLGYDFQASFKELAERGDADTCIVSTEDGFSPLGASLDFFSNDLGIPAEKIQRLANWNRFDNEQVTLVALGSRRDNGILRGIILAPGETARCYQKFAVPLHSNPYRDFYYNVTYEAIAFACGKWGARRLGISHLSASGHFHQDIATCHAEALAHFCDEHPDTAPESFVFCGCCIGVEHLKGIQQLNPEGASTRHRPITVSSEENEGFTRISLSWEHA